MLNLDIQKSKEATKISEFQKYIGGTTACMKKLDIYNKYCVQLESHDTYFSDSWFSSVKTSEEAMSAGVNYCGPEKTGHKGFCLATLENLMKYWPGGSYLVMRSTSRVTCGRKILEIRYKYNSRKFLGFIATEGAVSTEPGVPYLSHFSDIYSNASVHPFVLTDLIGKYFNNCNEI